MILGGMYIKFWCDHTDEINYYWEIDFVEIYVLSKNMQVISTTGNNYVVTCISVGYMLQMKLFELVLRDKHRQADDE